MTSQNFDQDRLKDVEDNLAKERELLKQFEDKLRYETEPRTIARLKIDIEGQKQTIANYQKEYAELKQLTPASTAKTNESQKSPQSNLTTQTASSQLSTIKIFLASSSELKDDREQFEIFINRKNKNYIKEGVFLELVLWEDFLDAMSPTRLQDEYNKAITDCDVFVSLFYTKAGKYTQEEFLKALESFQANNKPLIYTYFKDANIKTSEIKEDNILSLLNFKKKLQGLGHFPTNYTDINNLQYHFSEQLTKFLPQLIASKKAN